MADNDVSFEWAFDRLLDCDALTTEHLVGSLLPALGLSVDLLNDSTRARLCLRQLEDALSKEGAVTQDSGAYSLLMELAQCSEGVRGLADPALVCPPPALLLRVKTELALQVMRPGAGALPAPEAQQVLNALFANPSVDEYERFQRLSNALDKPAVVAALNAEFPYFSLIGQLFKYVAKAKVALPPLLKTVEADLLSGRYQPGRGGVAAAAIAPPSPPRRAPAGLPSPQRAGVASPARHARRASLQGLAAAAEEEEEGFMLVDGGGFESPTRQQRRAGKAPAAHAVVQQLQDSLDDMAQQGGKDPLPDALAAATLAAVGVDRRDRRGRTVAWQDSPAAVEHPMPELQAHHYARHSPLRPPSVRAQAPRGAAAAVEDGSPRPHPAEGQRRKRVYWTDAEVEELIRLVKMYGRGSWRTICDEGQAVFQGRRQQTDLKDKWRNLQKHMQPHEMQEIEAREAELREQMDNSHKRRPGRPPGYILTSPKRHRGEEDEEEERDEVEDADEEEEEVHAKGAARGRAGRRRRRGEAEEEEQEEEEEEGTEVEGEEPRGRAHKGSGRRGGGKGKSKGKGAPRRSGRRH